MYEIKVLDSDEFDKVAKSDPRYSYVDESNMGFADRQKGIAYVRGTNVHDLNKYLINHELEELEEAESTHEDPNGIRHKKFFKEIFLPLFTGFNGETGKWSPLGILDKSISKDAQQEKSQTVSSGMEGLQMSPFQNFTVSGGGAQSPASPRVSETVTGGIQSGLNQGQGFDGVQGLPPDLLQRLKGAPSGRIAF